MSNNITVLKSNGSNGSSLIEALNAMENGNKEAVEDIMHKEEEHEEHSFIDHIKQRAIEEYNDVITYIELSKMTEEKEFCKLLKEIAHEEWTHGKVLEHIIMSAKTLPEDIAEAKHEAEDALGIVKK
jgi:rubrerythrin